MKLSRHRELLLGFGVWCAACLVFTASAFAQSSANAVVVELRGTWPEPLAREVHADLEASLRERGVAVLDAKQPAAAARATLRIHPPTNEDLDVHVAIIDSAYVVVAERHLTLTQEHPDTWSVAIAATADELLATTWSLPERAAQGPDPADAPLETAPVKTEPPTLQQPAQQRAPTKASGAFVKETGRAETPKVELGVSAAGEHYTWGGTTYGGDVFFGVPVATSSSFSFAGVVRRIAREDSRDGQVTGTLAGANALFVQQLIGGRWTAMDVVSGVHAGAVWFSAESNDGARARGTTAALLSLRLGARFSVFTSRRTRVGLLVTSGVPLIRAVAQDSTRDVVRLGGLELGARLEVGWR